MVARNSLTQLLNEELGQSIIELILMLPVMIGLIILMIKINTAIQVSIVDQKYARAQALFLTFNSPFYPDVEKQVKMAEYGMNQMLVGVSGNLDSSGQGSDYIPEATIQNVARKSRGQPDDPGKEPVFSRSKVRIRNSVTLCTQNIQIGIGSGSGPKSVNPVLGGSVLSSVMDPRELASYCGSKMNYIR